MHRVEFTKTHCRGNDFVLIEARYVQGNLGELARRVCTRKTGVGADGLLVVCERGARFSLRYLNRDGSEAHFCGNGLLCAANWVRENGYRKDPISFSWSDNEYRVWSAGEAWRAEVPPVTDLALDVKLQSGRTVDCVSLGVPHAVRFESDLDGIDVEAVGREIRSDPHFDPDGVNVNFCMILGRDSARLRTYERGVEGETLSCGSGAAAASFIAHRRGMVDLKVVVLGSGGPTTVHIDGERVLLEGRPQTVYRGVLEIR